MTEKKCFGKYFKWNYQQEFINEDKVHIPPKKFSGCAYINVCKLRVHGGNEIGEVMPKFIYTHMEEEKTGVKTTIK